MRRRPGGCLEGAGEMELTEAGFVGERLDGQILAEMSLYEFHLSCSVNPYGLCPAA